jgi:hypothetical protein
LWPFNSGVHRIREAKWAVILILLLISLKVVEVLFAVGAIVRKFFLG